MRILVWHVHGAWTSAFVRGGHECLIPTLPHRGPDGRGRAATYHWPASAVEVTPEQAADAEVDVVVLQRPEELHGLAEWWLGGRRPGREVPAVYLEHDAPQGRIAEMRHVAADRDDLVLVHVTHFNELFWDCGSTPTRVIEHGVADPGERYSGELPRAAVVVNEPARRGRVTGTDLLERLAAATPLDLFGMGTEAVSHLEGVRALGDLPHDERLLDELARRRVYLHPVRWTSLGLSLVEAMHLAMPVVALATPRWSRRCRRRRGWSPSGSTPWPRPSASWSPTRSGRGPWARRRAAALARYGLGRFLHDWDRLLGEVVA